MQRRDFLKDTCRVCLLGAAGAALADIAGCSPAAGTAITKHEVINNKVAIAVASFDQKPLQIISPEKYPYEIAVEKKQDGTYKALLLKCTHYENELVPAGGGYSCNSHGSRFDKEGRVLKGPASSALIQLQTTVSNTEIIIHLI
jgi:Rieske Fe-S protein